MANVTPFFTRASNRICSWPLALAECITRGILCFGKIWERRNCEECQLCCSLAGHVKNIASVYSVIPKTSCCRIKELVSCWVHIFTIRVQIYCEQSANLAANTEHTNTGLSSPVMDMDFLSIPGKLDNDHNRVAKGTSSHFSSYNQILLLPMS